MTYQKTILLEQVNNSSREFCPSDWLNLCYNNNFKKLLTYVEEWKIKAGQWVILVRALLISSVEIVICPNILAHHCDTSVLTISALTSSLSRTFVPCQALNFIVGSSWFSILNFHWGYWQVELVPDAQHKTTFTIRQGMWRFKAMPFGLWNAPATFEHLMKRVLDNT